MQTISINLLIALIASSFLLSTEAQTTGKNDQQLLSTEAQTTGKNDQQLLSTEARVRGRNGQQRCRIRAVNRLMHGIIRNKLTVEALKLIEYKLTFRNYNCNPTTANVTRYHKADTWSRVSTSQGRTLLSLAFNYGVLSLMTLTSGTNSTEVELEDIPSGCIGKLPEEKKVELVRQLLMRDFKEDGNVSIVGEGRVCNMQIMNQSGYAKFTHNCCFVDTLTQEQICELNDANQWLRFMWLMLTLIRYGVLLFGPLLLLSPIAKLVNRKIPYVVKLKEPLQKTILLSKADGDFENYRVKRCINLRNQQCDNLQNLIKSLYKRKRVIGSNCKLLDGKPFTIFIYEYRILVHYTRLLVEDEVPIGLWKLIMNSVFFCGLREVGPFVDCCKQSICNRWPGFLWIKFWKAVGLILLVLLLPMPYYLRLFVFYFFEQDEVMARTEAVTRMGLKLSFENSIVHYLLPTHPLFLGIYVIYFTIAIACACTSKMEESPFHQIIVGSFEDLRNLSWFGVLHMMVSNVIWPFEAFGIFATFVVFIYWPIVLPITCLVSVGYSIPTIYLTIRMLFYSNTSIQDRLFIPEFAKTMNSSQQLFEIKTFWKLFFDSDEKNINETKTKDTESDKYMRKMVKTTLMADSEVDKMVNYKRKTRVQLSNSTKTQTTKPQSTTKPHCWKEPHKFIPSCANIAVHTCTATFCVVAMYSVLIILSECIGCLVEIVVFTMMGVIVNAGALLKYVSLAMLILVYVYDSFNNVEKKYLQLNKALFNNVCGRVKGVESETRKPSNLQENTGFKSQEISEQGSYEESDDIAKDMSRYWFINDLILFVDKEDVPRIPKKLFDEVCHIKVAGVPGPIYHGLFSALKSFAKMAIFVIFVFLAILSFGSANGLSSTTQTIAALAGGSVPLLLKKIIHMPKPDVDMGTVSFMNKLNEVVMNFYQFWPLKDFGFEMQKRGENSSADDNDLPIEWDNPVEDSKEGTSKNIRGRPIYSMFGQHHGIAARKRSNKGELIKLLRNERLADGPEVDILIILPKDFKEHEHLSEFGKTEKSQKDAAKAPVSKRGLSWIGLRKSKTRLPRTDLRDDVTENEGIGGEFKERELLALPNVNKP